ncbi:hypothetical protein LPJ57_006314, partial [Coemansia sp. RSA 486]
HREKTDIALQFAHTHAQSSHIHSLHLLPHASKTRLGLSRQYTTNAAPATKVPSVCDTKPISEFQAWLAAGNIEKAIESYSRVRLLFTTVAPSTHTGCQDKRMRRRRLKAPLWGTAFADLRRLHLLLRKASLAKDIKAVWKTHLLKTLICVIADMELLGLRIGATEIAAHIYAHYSLGQFSSAIDLWREAVAAISSGQKFNAESPQPSSVRHLFPQTHVYALQAAVQLKNVNVVRDVYTMSVSMIKGAAGAEDNAQCRSSVLALSQALFSVSKRAKTATGSDYPWDPSRLGYDFLHQIYIKNEQRTSGPDQLLATRLLRCMIRALCLNGDCKHAMHIYLKHTASLENSRYGIAPEILCEMVGGLCKHALVDEAHEILSEATSGSRSIYVWNTYFDGLVRHPQKTLKGRSVSLLERFQEAVQDMHRIDGIEPDTVTWSIWIRACFQLGDWHGAYKCFRDYFAIMSRDVASWDTVIRGLFQSNSPEAHAVGWQLVEEFISISATNPLRKDVGSSTVVVADSRLVETVLLHCFPRFSDVKSTYAYEVLSKDAFKKVVLWIEAKVSPQRKISHAIIIGTLLKSGRIRAALDMHQDMIDRQLWPTKSINCMIVKALVLAGSRRRALGSAADATRDAEDFIERRVPKQHYAAAYLPLVKCAALDRRYVDMWVLINRHYPWVVPKQEEEAAAAADTSRPFPDAAMYQAVLSATEATADWSENRRLLDKLRHHLNLVSDSGDKKFKTKMVGVYNHYIKKHI